MKSRSLKPTLPKYPRINFRTSADLVVRLNRIRDHAGLKPSQVIHACLNNYLPVIEARHGMLEVKS